MEGKHSVVDGPDRIRSPGHRLTFLHRATGEEAVEMSETDAKETFAPTLRNVRFAAKVGLGLSRRGYPRTARSRNWPITLQDPILAKTSQGPQRLSI
jgi:hypothetical protein